MLLMLLFIFTGLSFSTRSALLLRCCYKLSNSKFAIILHSPPPASFARPKLQVLSWKSLAVSFICTLSIPTASPLFSAPSGKDTSFQFRFVSIVCLKFFISRNLDTEQELNRRVGEEGTEVFISHAT